MHLLARKLRHGANLTKDDEEALARATGAVRRFPARADIFLEGAPARSLFVVLEGWACTYKVLENGKRQIISFLLPGDLSEPFGVLPNFSNHTVGAITAVKLVEVSLPDLQAAARNSPRMERALWWDLLVASAIDRERIVNLGRRVATERLGHLLCELHLRLRMVGLSDGLVCDFPLPQLDLADACGLSVVHVNRSLQQLRSSGLISLRNRRLTIHDLDQLQASSLFDPTYLHLREDLSGRALDAGDSMPVRTST